MTHLEEYIMEQVQNIWDKLPPLPSGWAYDLNFDYHFNHETRAYEVTTRTTPRKVCADSDYSGLNDFERAVHRGFLCAGVKDVPVDLIKETAKDFLAQLLKDAVEGRIRSFGFHNAIYYIKEPEWTEKLDKYKEGDKVRVIILPKEEPTNG